MKPPRVVLIEDNPADVYLVELALQESGVIYELTKFENGEEALRALCPPQGTDTSGFVPDAILLDLNTPKCDGFHVLITLKRSPHLAHVPMAVITSSLAASDKHRISLQGARYIQKPTQLEEFLTTVGQAIKDMIEERRASKSP
jgi:CheY-like chemotaxis protein